jgi:hypothetical protein
MITKKLQNYRFHNYAMAFGQFTVLMLPLTISLISHSINHLRDDSDTASGGRS